MKPVHIAAILAAISIASPTYSQGLRCSPPEATIPTCMAGAWIGTSSALENIKRLLDRMPPDSIERTTIINEVPNALGIHIFPNGFYTTLPLEHSVRIDDIETMPSGTSSFIQTDMTLTISQAFGWLWTEGDQMYFCDEPLSSAAVLHMEVNSDGRTAMTSIFPTGESGFTPEIDFSCRGDSLNFTVHLPDPVGNVDYYLTRVPIERFSDTYRDWIESRAEESREGE